MRPAKVPPPPSPSKFIKGDFHESDYESDVSLHYPTRSQYRPVHPNLTPTHGGRSTLGRTPTPPTEFDRPPTFEGPPRPKFEPIDKELETKPAVQPPKVVRPKPVNAKPIPVSYSHTQSKQDQKVMREYYTSEPVSRTYYTAVAGVPKHMSNAVATETSKTVQMKETSEKSQRTVNMTHTRRVINLDDQKQMRHEEKLEPFPYTAPPVSMRTRQRVPPPPTPTKFIPGEFRESDYESEVEGARIRPVWTPNPYDENDLRYRSVRPALQGGGRACSLPRSYDRVMTPMEFDHGPIMPSKIDILADKELYKTQTLDRSLAKKQKTRSKTTQDDIQVRNKFSGYKHAAQTQVESMSSQFKTKAHQFIQEIAQHQPQPPVKPVIKRASSVQAGDRKPQIYRDESRVSEYGKSFCYLGIFFWCWIFLFEF